MWPIFQHTLLMSCHINDSWGVVGEVFLGFLGFSGFLTNWNSSEVSAEEAFTGGVFLLSLSPLSFSSVCPNNHPSPFCSTWAHAASSPSQNLQVLSGFKRSRLTKSWGWWIRWMLRFCQWQNNCFNYFFNHFPSLSSLSKQPVTHRLYLVIHNCLLFQLYEILLKAQLNHYLMLSLFAQYLVSWKRLIACRSSFIKFIYLILSILTFLGTW